MTSPAAIVSRCPLCAQELTFRFSSEEIPFFGEIMLVSANCDCGFRYADTIAFNEREAARYEMEFDSDDFTTRVIRSSSGTVQIPELGVTIEPGSASEAFVSNVEGLLCRVEGVIKTATKWSSDDPAKFELGNRLLERIDALRRGEGRMTLVIDDPFGNSAIISPRARRRTLSEGETVHLKTGMLTIDVSE
ncbi:MAG TPA: ZPR1 zinc finger domain-containing protein [Candidatus Bathyarchaeia archaeon]|nr:ZPR1 zinc finger domain-containing protein [Candidatus Bathyarchaeia archaeon]